MVNGETPGGTTTFYNTISSPTEVAKDAIYITMTLIADTFVSYRLYMVWNRAWWILIIPTVLLLATAGTFVIAAPRSTVHDVEVTPALLQLPATAPASKLASRRAEMPSSRSNYNPGSARSLRSR